MSGDDPASDESGRPPLTGLEARRVGRNVPKVLLMNSAWMFLLIQPVIVPFWQGHGLSMREILDLQSIFAVCIVLFEVPSGYLADLFGRKNSLCLAGLFYGCAFTTLASVETFQGFVLFEVVSALGVSFYSGSDVALIYDTETALDEAAGTTHVLGRRLLWSQVGETVAAIVGAGILFLGWELMDLAYTSAVVSWTPLVIALTMVEPPRAKATHSHGENFRRIFHTIFRTTPILRLTFLALSAYGLATLMAVWLFQDYWKELGVPLAWFGVIWASYNLTVALTGRVATKIEKRIGAERVMVLIALCPIVAYAGMAAMLRIASYPVAVMVSGVLLGFLFQIGRGLTQVVIKGAFNDRVPAEFRATANSLSSLTVRLAFAALAVGVGRTIDAAGQDAALLGCAVLYVLIALAVVVPLLRTIRQAP